MKTLAQLTALLLAVVLPSCAGTGTGGLTSVPVNTQGAQDVGRDQGLATAAETGSATNSVSPTIFNINGAKSVKIKTATNGEKSVEVEGQDGGEVEISGANMGISFGDEGQKASISSGGGAAGGVGGTTRQSPAPVVPATPGGQ